MTAINISRRMICTWALGLGAGALARPGLAQQRLTVAAVNYPLAYFAERLAGDLADVNFPVPDGVDPSFWRPGIADIVEIQGADVILLNGAGFADWIARTTLPRSRIVWTGAAFEHALIATETVTHSHGEGGAHSHTGTASYTWLDFEQAQMQAAAIAAGLLRRAPEADAQIADRLAALASDLEALSAEAMAIGTEAGDVTFIASHPRYQYFERAYGFRIASVEWDAQEPPSQAQWDALETLVVDTGARVFIWEAAPGPEAQARMNDLGLQSAVFPPLANRPEDGDFLSAMQQSLAGLRDALRAASAG